MFNGAKCDRYGTSTTYFRRSQILKAVAELAFYLSCSVCSGKMSGETRHCSPNTMQIKTIARIYLTLTFITLRFTKAINYV